MPINAKYLMTAALAGLVSAFAFMSSFSGGILGVLLGVLSPLPLFFSAMTSGLLGTAIASGAGFALLAMQTPAILSGGFYLLGMGFAPLFLAWRLDRDKRFGPSAQIDGAYIGKQLSVIALLGGAAMALAILNADQALADKGGLTAFARDVMFSAINQMAAGSQMTNGEVADLKAKAAAMGNAAFIGSGSAWLLVMALNAALAALFAKRTGRFGGAALADLVLPRWFIFPLVAFSIMSFSAGSPGLAIGVLAITLVAAAALHGLAVIHSLSRGVTARSFLLAGIYVVCLLFNPAGILLALLGVADSRLGLRHRGAGS
jgi:hypothetical protein